MVPILGPLGPLHSEARLSRSLDNPWKQLSLPGCPQGPAGALKLLRPPPPLSLQPSYLSGFVQDRHPSLLEVEQIGLWEDEQAGDLGLVESQPGLGRSGHPSCPAERPGGGGAKGPGNPQIQAGSQPLRQTWPLSPTVSESQEGRQGAIHRRCPGAPPPPAYLLTSERQGPERLCLYRCQRALRTAWTSTPRPNVQLLSLKRSGGPPGKRLHVPTH